MAQNIKLKRSSVAGKVPTTSQLEAGEIAINTADGKLYFERDDSTIQTIVTTNATITGSLNINGPITGSDVQIAEWGSISASLVSIQSGANSLTLDNVTDNGSTTTNNITVGRITSQTTGLATTGLFTTTDGENTFTLQSSGSGGTNPGKVTLKFKEHTQTLPGEATISYGGNGSDIFTFENNQGAQFKFQGSSTDQEFWLYNGGGSGSMLWGDDGTEFIVRIGTGTTQFYGNARTATTASYALTASFVEFANIANKPTLVSGSAQIDLSQATGTAALAVSASYAFTASYVSPGAIAGTVLSASYAATASSADSFTVRTALTASGLRYPTTDGIFQGQVIQTDAAGNLAFGNVAAVFEEVYNAEATTLTKGTALYVSGAVGAAPKVYRADASDPAKMPVTFLAMENIGTGATGRGITLGLITGIDMTGFPVGDDLFVNGNGTLTTTRPTGSTDIVQPIGIVTKTGNGGQLNVLNPGPVLLPNLTAGKTWVGDSINYPVEVFTSSLLVTQAVSSSLAALATTASYALKAESVGQLNQNVVVNGNLTVFGTSSFTYVTSSQLNVDSAFISVNVFEPVERFGGLKVYDSGSSTATASLAWDSLHNHWVYQNASGSTYTGGMLLSGPRNTGSLGDEPNLTKWFVPRSDGGDHLDNSQIYSSGSVTQITGSLTTSGKVYIETVDNYGSDPDKFLSIVNNEVVYRTGAQLLSDIGGQTAGTFVQNAGLGGTARYIMRYEDSNSATTSSIYEDTSGNIGIKKTTPGAALDVNGSGIITGSLNVSGIGYLASVTSSQDIQVNGITVGRGTGNSNTNILLGSGSLGSLTTGTNNTVIGVSSNLSSTTSEQNTFVGNQVFITGSSANRSVGMGYQAMYNSSAASIYENVAIGYRSQYKGGGLGNVAVGAGAMTNGSGIGGVGTYNVAIGTYSMGDGPGRGDSNIGIGGDTLYSLTSGSNNIALGQGTLAGNTKQDHNIGLGYQTFYRTGQNDANGGNNIGIGRRAGYNMYSGSNNIFIGPSAGSSFDIVNNNVVIGGFDGFASPLASQSGNMILATGNGTIRMFVTGSNGNIALGGHTNPQFKVDITGSLAIRDTATVVQQGIQVSGTSTLTVASISTTSYDGAFLDYLIVSGSNRRAGTLATVWTASDIEWKDTSTLDLGSTNGAEFTPAINGSNADITLAVPAGTWTVKGHLRYM